MQKQKKNDNKTKKFKKAKKIFGGRVAEQQDDRWKDLWKEEREVKQRKPEVEGCGEERVDHFEEV